MGVKLWMASLCDDPRVFPVVEQCIEYRAPILIHSFHKAVGQLPFETTGEHVANLARRYPQARILMAHLGGNAYHGLPAIRDCPNVWTDICSSIFRGDSLSYALELLGEDRILSRHGYAWVLSGQPRAGGGACGLRSGQGKDILPQRL